MNAANCPAANWPYGELTGGESPWNPKRVQKRVPKTIKSVPKDYNPKMKWAFNWTYCSSMPCNDCMLFVQIIYGNSPRSECGRTILARWRSTLISVHDNNKKQCLFPYTEQLNTVFFVAFQNSSASHCLRAIYCEYIRIGVNCQFHFLFVFGMNKFADEITKNDKFLWRKNENKNMNNSDTHMNLFQSCSCSNFISHNFTLNISIVLHKLLFHVFIRCFGRIVSIFNRLQIDQLNPFGRFELIQNFTPK